MTSTTQDRPGRIEARPVRHPWRWVAMAVIAVLAAMMVSSFLTNDKWNFPFAFEIMQQSPVIEGLWKGTIFGTVGAMILGIGLGVVLAVMRLSDQPGAARGGSFVYTWFFRAMPRYVLLVLLWHRHRLPLPQLRCRHPRSGSRSQGPGLCRCDLTFFGLSLERLLQHDLGRDPRSRPLRSGLHGRDRPRGHPVGRPGPGRGGPSPGDGSAAQTMRRIVLPQAMRVIVPPTGNETIAMVKDTSLLIAAVPVLS
jgi:polar amino acid transport system permease protein